MTRLMAIERLIGKKLSLFAEDGEGGGSKLEPLGKGEAAGDEDGLVKWSVGRDE